ncbi:hypothetical protein ACET4A_29900, partial [Pseudomonas aeruginosa]
SKSALAMLRVYSSGPRRVRHAWMQARAAAPPAHPRVTGDHHA